jgi:hypothetical protein
VRVEYWKGGDEDVEPHVFEGADVVVGSGGEELVNALRLRVPGPRILHGPRLSVGVVGFRWPRAAASWWCGLGREIALWDQGGCLSPRILFVAGDPERFAERLAQWMAIWEARWPARPRTAGEAAAVHAFRAHHEMMEEGGCVAPAGTAWTVAWDREPSLCVGPPHRVVRVTAKPRTDHFEALLTAHPDEVQAVGLSHLVSRTFAWKAMAHRAGVPFTTPLTRIQDPPAGWRADGRSGLVELLRLGGEGPLSTSRHSGSPP